MTQPSEEAMRVWRTSLNTFCQHGGHVITIPASAEDAAATVIQQALDDQVARIVAWLRADNSTCDCFARDEWDCGCGGWDDYKTRPLLDIANDIERGEWRYPRPTDSTYC